jgi:16S rRNA (guanine966-N2)-methyltransferase
MRIIAGEHRGRIIQAPPGVRTRPMLDRVREALFATLGDRLERARVLDLFAGSGSLGLEALSRGALSARLVERDPATLRLLRANVDSLALAERARIVGGDALSASSWGDGDSPSDYEVVFLDPPYPMLRDGAARQRVLRAIESLASRLASGGTIVLHAPRGLLRGHDFGSLASEERIYGTSSLWYLERAAAEEQA